MERVKIGITEATFDGHVSTMILSNAAIKVYPDKKVLTEDGSYPN